MKFCTSLSLAIMCIGLPVLMVAQIPMNPNKTDEQGRRQGTWTIIYDKEKPTTDTSTMVFYRLITYKDDKPIGLISNIRKNGKLMSTASAVQDRPKPIWTGLLTLYNQDGIKEAAMQYDNGEAIGYPQIFYTDGSIISDSVQFLTGTGASLIKEGRLREALPFVEKALIMAAYSYGKKEPEYLEAMESLISLYNKLGMTSKAEPLLKKRKEIAGY